MEGIIGNLVNQMEQKKRKRMTDQDLKDRNLSVHLSKLERAQLHADALEEKLQQVSPSVNRIVESLQAMLGNIQTKLDESLPRSDNLEMAVVPFNVRDLEALLDDALTLQKEVSTK
jgi:type I site-specific restriction endonuclease